MDNLSRIIGHEIIDEDEMEMLGDLVANIPAPMNNAPIEATGLSVAPIATGNIVNIVNNAVILLDGEERNIVRIKPRGDPVVSVPNYFEKIIPGYSEQQFYQHFRMSRDVFEELVVVIQSRGVEPGDEIPLRKRILLTIWVLATQDSFRSVADRFGLAKSSAHKVFREIVTILAELVSVFVGWPNEEELQKSEKTFFLRSRNRFPGIVGAIDGCHVQIKQPPHDANDYFNRKQTHSVILQGTCDHTGKFIDVLIGRPGRCHDASVFRSSAIYERLMNPTHPLLPNHRHLLGDSGYPLSTSVLTPFKDNGHLSEQKNRYNITHASCRSIIERAFGLLKGKFRRLFYLDVRSVRMANLIIAASCTLHNFILTHGQANIGDNINLCHDEGEDLDVIDDANDNAVNKRNRIVELM